MIVLHLLFWLLKRAKINTEQSFFPYGVANNANSFSVRLLTMWPAPEKPGGAGGESRDVQTRITCISRREEEPRNTELHYEFACGALLAQAGMGVPKAGF